MEDEKMSGNEEVFPQRMKEYREKTGQSQKEIADKLGLNRVTYIYYESGKRQPGYSFLRDFSKLSGWTPSYLLGLSEYKTLDQQADAVQLTLEGDSEAVKAAAQIRQTAKILLDRYNTGINRIFGDYLEPLSRVCEKINESQANFTYNKDGSARIWKSNSAAQKMHMFSAYMTVTELLYITFNISDFEHISG